MHQQRAAVLPCFRPLTTIREAVTDYSAIKFAFTRHDSMDMMMTNLMLFSTSELPAGNSAHRLGIILPLREDGGVELSIGTFPEELAPMLRHEEWMRYATLMSESAA
ncbi:hypothetical protein B0T24DRAFT_699559 [Lasiosphaeria ovina]|uniref:Uncharacterized protein n=1 Tax=Lasiosphaeria ovina TaxID=92902 RepID=A0AAE0KG91_9PEZI|nr:hypothetical protein B0T24DRAFT_699559 [Lasiosphaeria ovina]